MYHIYWYLKGELDLMLATPGKGKERDGIWFTTKASERREVTARELPSVIALLEVRGLIPAYGMADFRLVRSGQDDPLYDVVLKVRHEILRLQNAAVPDNGSLEQLLEDGLAQILKTLDTAVVRMIVDVAPSVASTIGELPEGLARTGRAVT